MIRLTEKLPALNVKPGMKTEVFGEWYWVRYIHYLHNSVTLSLQPESEPLSPLYTNDVISLTVNNDVMFVIEVME